MVCGTAWVENTLLSPRILAPSITMDALKHDKPLGGTRWLFSPTILRNHALFFPWCLVVNLLFSSRPNVWTDGHTQTFSPLSGCQAGVSAPCLPSITVYLATGASQLLLSRTRASLFHPQYFVYLLLQGQGWSLHPTRVFHVLTYSWNKPT